MARSPLHVMVHRKGGKTGKLTRSRGGRGGTRGYPLGPRSIEEVRGTGCRVEGAKALGFRSSDSIARPRAQSLGPPLRCHRSSGRDPLLFLLCVLASWRENPLLFLPSSCPSCPSWFILFDTTGGGPPQTRHKARRTRHGGAERSVLRGSA